MSKLVSRRTALATGLATSLTGVGYYLWPAASKIERVHPLAANLSFEDYTNSYFTPEPLVPELPPSVTPVSIPQERGSFSIWGASGRDAEGHLWFAVSKHNVGLRSASLYEYDPSSNVVKSQSDVLTELGRAGLMMGECQQPKIHTKIIRAGDGHLYFASSDENSKGIVGQVPPPHGSHLWRVLMPSRRWEHLASFPEGIIAIAGGGGLIYGLGFPDHTVIQFDCLTNDVKRVSIGSIEGHISRNLLADHKGHVYVPRLRLVTDRHAEHTLVELDPDLRIVKEMPLPYYQDRAASENHGIIGYTYMADKTIMFITNPGRLFQLMPSTAESPTRLIDLGWFHPSGTSYAPCLFTYSGTTSLCGFAQGTFNAAAGAEYHWVNFDVLNRSSKATPVRLPRLQGVNGTGETAGLFGCHTRDVEGSLCVVGAYAGGKYGRFPVLLKVNAI